MRKTVAHCAVALGLALGAAQASASLVTNGGFESDLASWSTSGFLLEGYDHGVDGAVVHSGNKAFYGGGIEAYGFLSQSLATTVGATYSLSFWLYSDGYLPNALQVLTDGLVRYSSEDVLLQDYARITTTFTATQAQTELSFALRNDAGYLWLDSVEVNAVPEPATAALLALGLAVTALRRRRAA